MSTNESANVKSGYSNFGLWGWAMVIFSLFMYYFWAAWTTDALNLLPQSFARLHGWDAALLLSFSTPAGWLGVIGGFVFGQVIIKKGVRFVMVLCLLLAGAVTFWFGQISSVVSYAVAVTLIAFFANGYGQIATGTLLTTWFPKKKGMALAWATMGMPLCTATFVPILAYLFSHYGIPNAMAIMAGVLIVMAIIAFFLIKNTPEEIGAYPDNEPLSQEELKANLEEMESYQSPFTVKALLKDRDMWLISIGCGMLWLVTVGIVSQLVPRLISIGYSEATAIAFLSAAAVCAIPGSYLWGWLDQKIGTRAAIMCYAALYIVTLILLLVQGGSVLTFITIVGVGLGLGGIKNLITSMVGTVYGRYDFPAANRLINPIANLVNRCAFAVMALGLAMSGSYAGSYIAFIVIDIIGLILVSRITPVCKGKI